MSCCQACNKSKTVAGLCHDHHGFLELLSALEAKLDPRGPMLDKLVHGSEEHHRIEETKILPILEKKGYAKLASQILIDHAMLKTLKTEVQRSKSAGEARIRLARLAKKLREHIQLETSTAFPLST